MINRSKILNLVFLLVCALLLIAYFLKPSFKTEVCPPDKCKVYETGKNGQPIGTTIKPEPGRVRTDFSTAPPGLPKDLPVDPKPTKVVTSYIETMVGDKSIGELPHTQITYSYITKQDVKTISDNLQNYLRKNNYDVQLNPEDPTKMRAFYGHRISGPTDQSITVSIVQQNQFEQLVTISLIISAINKNQK